MPLGHTHDALHWIRKYAVRTMIFAPMHLDTDIEQRLVVNLGVPPRGARRYYDGRRIRAFTSVRISLLPGFYVYPNNYRSEQLNSRFWRRPKLLWFTRVVHMETVNIYSGTMRWCTARDRKRKPYYRVKKKKKKIVSIQADILDIDCSWNVTDTFDENPIGFNNA